MPRHNRANEYSVGDFIVSLANEQSVHAVDELQLAEIVRRVLADSEFTSADISLAVVDDSTIHAINRRHLNHDWPTDVLSFLLDERDGRLEGEIVISADTAAAVAAEVGWPAAAEQLLYVVHGALHLVGYDDKTPDAAGRMRIAEAKYLRHFGFEPPSAVPCKDGQRRVAPEFRANEGQVAR